MSEQEFNMKFVEEVEKTRNFSRGSVSMTGDYSLESSSLRSSVAEYPRFEYTHVSSAYILSMILSFFKGRDQQNFAPLLFSLKNNTLILSQ